MIESIWNNIQTDWLQSPKNKNNNFQTLRTVRVSLTVKNQCMSDTLMNKTNQHYSLRSLKVVNKLLAISLVFLFLNSNDLLHFNNKLCTWFSSILWECLTFLSNVLFQSFCLIVICGLDNACLQSRPKISWYAVILSLASSSEA